MHPPVRVVRVDHRERGVGQREHEVVLGSQHPVDLAEDTIEVVDRGEPEGGHDPVDGVGPHEGQLGERGVVELELHALTLGRGACLRHLV